MRHRFPITAGLLVGFWLVILVGVGPVFSQPPDGDAMIAEYFRVETARLSDACLADVTSLEDWEAKRPEYRRQLLEMLGLDPMPERTDLQAVVTGQTEHDEFVVERLHFQSLPGLYVTANLYLPRDRPDPLPAILYVCGHGASKKDGISFGNKATYQHHGAWFARHGFACLTIDTLQMGEIEGIHHGTYRYDMWWWLNRGYTPAGVEAWNCVRALDYLQSRPEIDPERLGVTGRSGGGAYSWWIAAIDERIRAAVPVAGITDLENHVVDGCVEGHCDCMYMVNTYALGLPPGRGPGRSPAAAAEQYRPRRHLPAGRRGADLRAGTADLPVVRQAGPIGPANHRGPHRDTQELHIHAFRWMNQHLRGDDSLIEKAAVKFFDPPELKVFETLPEDQLNTTIHETFVPAAPEPPVPRLPSNGRRCGTLGCKRCATNPSEPGRRIQHRLALELRSSAVRDGVRFSVYEFDSQQAIRLPLYLVQPDAPSGSPQITLDVLDDPAWTAMLARYQVAFADHSKDCRCRNPRRSLTGLPSRRSSLPAGRWPTSPRAGSVRRPGMPVLGNRPSTNAGSICSDRRWTGCGSGTSAAPSRRFGRWTAWTRFPCRCTASVRWRVWPCTPRCSNLASHNWNSDACPRRTATGRSC
jgi:hypothetical protein